MNHATTRNALWIAAWLPAALGVMAICGESTRAMGADHTAVWLRHLCSPLVNVSNMNLPEVNHVLRKCGHFFGYGTLGLVFVRGWLSLLLARMHQTWTRVRTTAAGLGILSVALVASMDELHQSFLPNRTACVSDVVLDTSGALFLVSMVALGMLLQRRRALARLMELRTDRTWHANSWRLKQILVKSAR